MNRRNFIKTSGLAGGALYFSAPILNSKKDPFSRIALTTVVFRKRFAATAGNDLQNEMHLKDIPEFFSDRFGIRKLEFWSQHFESKDQAYLAEIKKAIKKYRCELINIQADTKNDVSDPDKSIHSAGIAEMKEWIDTAAFLGAKMVRNGIMKKSYDQARDSLSKLVGYASSKGIMLLVENHNDLFSVTENHLNIVRDMEGKKFGLLADFGNYRGETDRFEALAAICPYTKLVSAKMSLFDQDYNHTSFDFDKCVQTMEAGGYKGIYSIEQYSPPAENYDFERIVDWSVERIKSNI